MNPKISIIVPIYNVEKYLTKCLDSLINQTYKNLEIILVDDGSPDNCGKICDEYKLKDDRIIVIHQKNKGLSGARNAGLDVAIGDYIAFVDSDDWIELDMYKTMIKIALEHQFDIVECGINRSGIEEEAVAYNFGVIKKETIRQALKRILENTQFSSCTKLFKKLIIGDSRFLLNKTSEDIFFMFEIIPKMNKMGYINYPFYHYRPNPTSITKSPYNLNRFDHSITACLFVEEEIMSLISRDSELKQGVKDQELIIVLKSFILKEFMHHYKMLNYYPDLDPKYIHRKKLKKLIDENYCKSITHISYIKLANLLSVSSFEVIINLNKFRHRVLKTNQFS